MKLTLIKIILILYLLNFVVTAFEKIYYSRQIFQIRNNYCNTVRKKQIKSIFKIDKYL